MPVNASERHILRQKKLSHNETDINDDNNGSVQSFPD